MKNWQKLDQITVAQRNLSVSEELIHEKSHPSRGFSPGWYVEGFSLFLLLGRGQPLLVSPRYFYAGQGHLPIQSFSDPFGDKK